MGSCGYRLYGNGAWLRVQNGQGPAYGLQHVFLRYVNLHRVRCVASSTDVDYQRGKSLFLDALLQVSQFRTSGVGRA